MVLVSNPREVEPQRCDKAQDRAGVLDRERWQSIFRYMFDEEGKGRERKKEMGLMGRDGSERKEMMVLVSNPPRG